MSQEIQQVAQYQNEPYTEIVKAKKNKGTLAGIVLLNSASVGLVGVVGFFAITINEPVLWLLSMFGALPTAISFASSDVLYNFPTVFTGLIRKHPEFATMLDQNKARISKAYQTSRSQKNTQTVYCENLGISSKVFGYYMITFSTSKPKFKKITTMTIQRLCFSIDINDTTPKMQQILIQQDELILKNTHLEFHEETRKQITRLIKNTAELMTKYVSIPNPSSVENKTVEDALSKLNHKLKDIYGTVLSNTVNRMGTAIIKQIDTDVSKQTVTFSAETAQLELL